MISYNTPLKIIDILWIKNNLWFLWWWMFSVNLAGSLSVSARHLNGDGPPQSGWSLSHWCRAGGKQKQWKNVGCPLPLPLSVCSTTVHSPALRPLKNSTGFLGLPAYRGDFSASENHGSSYLVINQSVCLNRFYIYLYLICIYIHIDVDILLVLSLWKTLTNSIS